MNNLQLFAEGEGDGSGAGNGNEDGAGAGSGDSGNEMSFDDFLGQAENRAEFDRRVQKAVNTAVTKAQEKWQALTDDKLSEAEKLAKMTKEEKAEYKTRKLEKELADLKRQNAVTEWPRQPERCWQTKRSTSRMNSWGTWYRIMQRIPRQQWNLFPSCTKQLCRQQSKKL